MPCVYRLTNETTKNFYIGSTISKLYTRFATHKCKKKLSIFQDGSKVKREILENFDNISSLDLRKREKHFWLLQKDDPLCINIKSPYTDALEYGREHNKKRRENPEYRAWQKEYQKQYYLKNRLP